MSTKTVTQHPELDGSTSRTDGRPAQLSLSGRVLLATWFVFVSSSPIYLFEEGGLQPADAAFVALALWLGIKLISGSRLSIPERFATPIKWLGWLVAWTVLVNAVWANLLNDFSLLIPIAYYSYAIVLVLLCGVLLDRFRRTFLAVTLYGFGAAVVVVLAVTLLGDPGSDPGSIRQIGTFKNPNQLGYFAVIAASALAYLTRWTSRTWQLRVLLLFLWVSVVYLTVASSSLAALYSLAAFFVIALVQSPLRTGAVLLLSLVLFASTAVGAARIESLALRSAVVADLTGSTYRGDTDVGGPLEYRGYDRIWNNPQHLLLGAGEGEAVHERFPSDIGDHEIHSSVGTIVFSYGLIGLILFGVFVWKLHQASGWRRSTLLIPVFLYSLTHQGLRFRLFWVLVALTLVAAVLDGSRESRAGHVVQEAR